MDPELGVELANANQSQNAHPFTIKYLENRFKVSAQSDGVQRGEADIIIKIGGAYKP